MGIGLVFLTTLINYFIYKIPCKGSMNAVGLPSITLVLRIIVFITMFCITIFVINPSLLEGYSTFDEKMLFQPINAVIMLFVYMIPVYSYFTVAGVSLFGPKPY